MRNIFEMNEKRVNPPAADNFEKEKKNGKFRLWRNDKYAAR